MTPLLFLIVVWARINRHISLDLAAVYGMVLILASILTLELLEPSVEEEDWSGSCHYAVCLS